MVAADRNGVLTRAREVLMSALPDAWAIYAYGSFARGDQRPDSDLDLAVLVPPGQRLSDRSELADRVSREVGREVDLVDLRRVGLDLIREVLREGLMLHVGSESDTLAWEAEQMTAYADFNPRRADLLAFYLREPLTQRP